MSVLSGGGFGQIKAEEAVYDQRALERARKGRSFGARLGESILSAAASRLVGKTMDVAGETLNRGFQEDFDNFFNEQEQTYAKLRDSKHAETLLNQAKENQSNQQQSGLSAVDYHANRLAPNYRAIFRQQQLKENPNLPLDAISDAAVDTLTFDKRQADAKILADRDKQLLEYDGVAKTAEERKALWNKKWNPRSQSLVESGLTFIPNLFGFRNEEKAMEKMLARDKDGNYLDTSLRNVEEINQIADNAKLSGDYNEFNKKLQNIKQGGALARQVLKKDFVKTTIQEEEARVIGGKIQLLTKVTTKDLANPDPSKQYTTRYINLGDPKEINDSIFLNKASSINDVLSNIYNVKSSNDRQDIFKLLTEQFPKLDLQTKDFLTAPAYSFNSTEDYNKVLNTIDSIVAEKDYEGKTEINKAQKSIQEQYLRLVNGSTELRELQRIIAVDPESSEAADAAQSLELIYNRIANTHRLIVAQKSKQVGLAVNDVGAAVIVPNGFKLTDKGSAASPQELEKLIRENLAFEPLEGTLFDTFNKDNTKKYKKFQANFVYSVTGLSPATQPTVEDDQEPIEKPPLKLSGTDAQKYEQLLEYYDGDLSAMRKQVGSNTLSVLQSAFNAQKGQGQKRQQSLLERTGNPLGLTL